MPPKLPEPERRHYQGELVLEERQDGAAARIKGLAAVYDSLSVDFGGFREKIRPGAFRAVLAANPDVRALVNHSANRMIGRTKSGTLILSEDQRGLHYEVEVADTSAGRDAIEQIKRGDLDGSSFAFRVEEAEWREEEGVTIREIIQFSELADVGPVTYPAYEDTTVAMRSLERWSQANGMAVADALRRCRLWEWQGQLLVRKTTVQGRPLTGT